MRLKVLLPTSILVDREVGKVVAEAENGSFCLLPRHIDFVAALTPGILSFESADKGEEEYVAVDQSILVKCGTDILVSTRRAVHSKDLERLEETLMTQFNIVDEQEKRARLVLAKLETDLVRRIWKLRD